MDHPSLEQQTTTITTSTSTGGHGGPKDPTNTIIIKGKRTKRQRQQSSIHFTIVTHSSTSYNTFNSSPASSYDFPTGSITTEDEDTANCLILLSKGHNMSPANNNNNNTEEFSNYKFNSKRYIQTSTDDNTNGITGMYVYECKTCSRTFPSFQALGGHRTSHKKPRINEKPARYTTTFSDEDEPSPQFLSKKNNSSSSSSLSLQFNHRVYSNMKKLSSKLHECSICGTEFTSGQALGGHMRRHRAANVNTATNTNTNTTLSLIPYNSVTTMVVEDQDNQKSRNDGLCLDLDLNLPAPPESAVVVVDQHQESSFKFMENQNKQQPGFHLSTTRTLVDCHY